MTFPPFTRRSLISTAMLLGPVLRTASVAQPDPILAAIRRAEAADLAFAHAALPSHVVLDIVSRASHRAYRTALHQARSSARLSLHTFTPQSEVGARALVAFYARRAERTGSRGARRAGLRRLREVCARPGVCQPGRDLATAWTACLPALTHHPPG